MLKLQSTDRRYLSGVLSCENHSSPKAGSARKGIRVATWISREAPLDCGNFLPLLSPQAILPTIVD